MNKLDLRMRPWRALALVLSLIAISVPAGVEARSPTQFGVNLVKDASAEDATPDGGIVPIPKWTTSTGFTAVTYGTPGFPTAAQASGFESGTVFFSGGPSNAKSKAKQLIPIFGRDAVIDTGRALASYSVRIASYDAQGDNGTLKVRFRRANGSRVGSVFSTMPVSATNNEFTYVSGDIPVPVGTRTIEVLLIAKRAAGDYNDAFFDTVSIKLYPHG